MFTLPYKRKDQKEVRDAYDRVFNSPDGSIVLNHLLGEVCGLSRVSLPNDDKLVFKDLGKQQVGYEILNILNPNKE